MNYNNKTYKIEIHKGEFSALPNDLQLLFDNHQELGFFFIMTDENVAAIVESDNVVAKTVVKELLTMAYLEKPEPLDITAIENVISPDK